MVLRDFGRELFRGIFVDAGSIRGAYERSKGILASDGQKSLRLKLRIDSPELASLPWEYLYDPDETPSYISLQVPLVRYLEMLGAPAQMRVKRPLRILGMIANPGTSEWPRLDEPLERRRIAEGIDKLQREGSIVFEWVAGGTGPDLLSKLLEKEWHIFHFIGHGGVDIRSDEHPNDELDDSTYLVLVDESGRPVKKYASDLAILLATPKKSLRLAVLNCCDSATSRRDGRGSPAVALIRSGLPAVVAMQFPFSDTAAIRLSQGFYQALANNQPVDAAVTTARRFIQNDSNIEWAIPVLYMRAADGSIFELDTSSPIAAEYGATSPVGTIDGTRPKDTTRGTEAKLNEFSQLANFHEKSADDLEKLARLGRELVGGRKSDQLLATQVARVYYELGLRQLRQGDFLKAGASLAYAIELDPSEPDYRICHANLYARVGLYELALSAIAEAINLRPDNAEYHWIRGIVHSMAAGRDDSPGLWKEAIRAFDIAIKLNPQEAKYLASRADALAQTDRSTEALADLDRAISLSPSNADYVAQRAKLVQGILCAA
jgi:tetratricopeptide (TPR) repeat protein